MEAEIEDGGPAYPTPCAQPFGDGRTAIGGLTKRDHFACAAMREMLGASYMTMMAGGHATHSNYDEVLAESAYKIADAMLRARLSPSAATGVK